MTLSRFVAHALDPSVRQKSFAQGALNREDVCVCVCVCCVCARAWYILSKVGIVVVMFPFVGTHVNR